jgi:hypothetical protein
MTLLEDAAGFWYSIRAEAEVVAAVDPSGVCSGADVVLGPTDTISAAAGDSAELVFEAA